eukprot:555631-Pleurochrysis_carterae.AAC.1
MRACACVRARALRARALRGASVVGAHDAIEPLGRLARLLAAARLAEPALANAAHVLLLFNLKGARGRAVNHSGGVRRRATRQDGAVQGDAAPRARGAR